MPLDKHLPPPVPGDADAAGIRTFLVGELAGILQVDAETIDSSVEFASYGLDSIAMFQAVGDLAQWLGREVDATLLWEYPTIDAAAAFLANQVEMERFVPMEKADRGQPLPMSFGQRQMWLVQQTLPDPATYNQPVAYHLRGNVDRDRIRRSLQVLVERHEILRTGLIRQDECLVQQIIAPEAMTLPWTEEALDSVGAEVRIAEMALRLAEEVRRPFDLAQAPLWRALWICLEKDEYLLSFTFHHSILDERSLRLLFHEWEWLYAADARLSEAGLPILPVSYADFAVWQRQRLTGPLLDRLRAYWSVQLNNLPPVLELPADRVPSQRRGRGAIRSFKLGSELTAGLRELARQEGFSLFTLMFAALQVLLYRYTGQEDIIVGTPAADRSRPEVQSLLGFFLNTLPIRTQLKSDLSFRRLLSQVRKTVREALEHADLPFEQIVEIAALNQNGSPPSMFRTMFALVEEGLPQRKLFGFDARPYPIHTGTSKSDLVLNITAEGEIWGCQLEYATDLFTPEIAGQMTVHFEELLQSILADPDEAIGNLNILPDDERFRLLVEWNQTDRDYRSVKCIHQLFEDQAARTPNAPAVADENKNITYAELNVRANKLAHHLRSLGVDTDVHVGVCMNRSVELIVALLGILKAGGTYVPLDPNYPSDRLAFLLKDLAAPVIVAQEAQRDLIQAISTEIHLLCLDADTMDLANSPNADLEIPCSTGSVAYVIYTSGSTGQPKGVRIPHCAISRLVIDTDYVQLGPGDVVAQASTCTFDAATFEIWGALLNGAQLAIIDKETVLSAKRLGLAIERHAISALFLTTALFNHLSRENAAIFGTLKHLLFGGEACDPGAVRAVLMAAPPSRLLHVYGPTETTTFATSYRVTTVPEDATTIPVGRPITNTRIYLLDTHLNPVPVGVAGELYIGGAGLACGYLNRPDLTAEKFVALPFDPISRFYKTGDLARWRADGELEFRGRLDDQVKIRGYRVDPGETEATLRLYDGVKEAIMIAREENGGEKRLVAYIVGAVTQTELRQFLKSRLPDYMCPSAYVILETLPLTPNGKVDRKALPTPGYQPGAADETFVPPDNEREKVIAKVWSEVLMLKRISVEGNFFEMGGHSMSAVQMLARLESAIAVKIPLAMLFAHPTVRELAAQIELRRGLKTSNVIPIQEHGVKSPFILFYGDVIPGANFCYELGQRFGEDQPLYIVSPPDLKNYPTHFSLEETVRVLLESVRSVRPNGPYVLAGYCYGGLVAYEAARQLEAAGEHVENLILIDSFSPKRRVLQIVRRFIQRAGGRAGINERRQQRIFMKIWKQVTRAHFWLKLRGRDKFVFFRLKIREWLARGSRRSRHSDPPAEDSRSTDASPQSPLFDEALLAFQWELAGYRARPYSGRFALLLSEDAVGGGRNTAADRWRELVTRMDVHPIAGNHGECVTSQRDVLFEKLKSCVGGDFEPTQALDRVMAKESVKNAASGTAPF